MRFMNIAAALVMMGAVAACASGGSSYAKPGFYTHVHDGRLWVLKSGDKEIDLVSKNQEPKVVVTRIGEGPNGMTIKSNDGKVIEDYLKAK
ncbi:MAG: hypothetical protein ACK4FJ_17070 [Ferrovibrio sp.]|uniref:hypothetical protein n=1 Tax=Ferrovibrio sp. TaxID=1917215 RepID=UPI00391A036A